ncbi:uncharacterized protein KY384_008044 [Bacidia gigantensis]|uniref:uncharacterized protein n=1 Tax=Bacidia gigantensis TaxID=2732470 RepID=UPI001D0576A8|nr:uncharacterized protein KY384_008044 [Bacidia gigantensis]KAG8527300.1 hypothetical protein KY384_008044 [Bacidia gigantensis]
MSFNQPNLGQLQIISATFGGQDITTAARNTLLKALTLNPSLQIWSFQLAGRSFGEDPDPNVLKCLTLVYRNSIPASTDWSAPKSITKQEGASVNIPFDGKNDVAWSPPSTFDLPANGLLIIAAYWWTGDVTELLKAKFAAMQATANKPTILQIGTDLLGTAPTLPTDVRTKRTFSVTYGLATSVGFKFGVAVGNPPQDDTPDWPVQLPFAFPPAQTPMYTYQGVFINLKNASTDDKYLYPKVVALDGSPYGMALITDMRLHQLAAEVDLGQDVDLALVERAGCIEGDRYYVGFTARTAAAPNGTIAGDSWLVDTRIQASTAATKMIISVTWSTDTNGVPSVEWSGLTPRSMNFTNADLRLNIYACVFGGVDCTQWFRQQYVTSVLQTPPTNAINQYVFTPTTSFFGGDPQPNIRKVCIIIYRLAYAVSSTNGIITNPSDPPITDPKWQDGSSLQPFHTATYPILKNISDFRTAAQTEDVPLPIDLLSIDQTPIVFPMSNYPFIAAALWQDTPITERVKALMEPYPPLPTTTDLTFLVSAASEALHMDEPWPDTPKQTVVLYGLKTPATSPPGLYTYALKISFNNPNAPYTFTMPITLDALPLNTAWPAPTMGSSARREPTYRYVTFFNNTDNVMAGEAVQAVDLWPQVCKQDSATWDAWERGKGKG